MAKRKRPEGSDAGGIDDGKAAAAAAATAAAAARYGCARGQAGVPRRFADAPRK